MTETLPTIGWIGTGRMGSAITRRLLGAGNRVAVYNRTRAKAEPLIDDGAVVVDRPIDLAGADVVFVMVSNPASLNAVMFGEGGLLTDSQRAPRLIVDSSTVSLEASADLRAKAKERGTELIAAPVSGNPAVIDAGKLTVAASGPREVFDSVRPLLEAFGRGVTYVGDGEAARLIKIAHNVFLGVVTQSLAEVTVLAERGGVSREAFLAFLNDSVMGSVFTRYKTPAFVNLDFTPTFTNVLLSKDMELGLAEGRRLGVPMPVASATGQLVHAAVGAGHTEGDFATLLLEQARSSGYTPVSEEAAVSTGLEVAEKPLVDATV